VTAVKRTGLEVLVPVKWRTNSMVVVEESTEPREIMKELPVPSMESAVGFE